MHPTGQGSTATGAEQPKVLLVLTDEELIYERREVPADYVDEALKLLNGDLAASSIKWRRGIVNCSAPLNSLCGSCGSRRCWCGVSRSRTFGQEPRR
jgi:hypothetical protein